MSHCAPAAAPSSITSKRSESAHLLRHKSESTPAKPPVWWWSGKHSRKGHWAPFQTWLSHEPAVWAQASHLNPGPTFPSANWGKTSSSRSRVTVCSSPLPHWWLHTPALAPSRTMRFQEQGMGMSCEMKIPGGKKLSLATGKLSPSTPTQGRPPHGTSPWEGSFLKVSVRAAHTGNVQH